MNGWNYTVIDFSGGCVWGALTLTSEQRGYRHRRSWSYLNLLEEARFSGQVKVTSVDTGWHMHVEMRPNVLCLCCLQACHFDGEVLEVLGPETERGRWREDLPVVKIATDLKLSPQFPVMLWRVKSVCAQCDSNQPFLRRKLEVLDPWMKERWYLKIAGCLTAPEPWQLDLHPKARKAKSYYFAWRFLSLVSWLRAVNSIFAAHLLHHSSRLVIQRPLLFDHHAIALSLCGCLLCSWWL